MAQQGIYRDPTVVTARVVVPGPIAEYSQPWSLTTGSQLNQATKGGPTEATPLGSGSSLDVAIKGAPWPDIINGAVKFFNSWRPNALRQVANHNVAGNYGSMTSMVNFATRGFEFDGYDVGGANGMVAGYPGTGGPGPKVNTYNTLIPLIYGLRVLNPVANGGANNTSIPAQVVSQFTTPTNFTPTGTAVLANRGGVLT